MATRTGGDGSPRLDIRVLGALDLRLGERRLPPLESARAESLLTYLLVHRDAPQPRERIAFVLWPDSTEPQARTNLRKVLHTLRHALPDADRFLEVTQRTLQWRPDAPCSLDLAIFEDAIARSRWEDLNALREAVEAYGGDLLASSYDEWLIDERERLRELYAHALERLAEALAQRGDHADAVRYGERLLRLDPLREESCRLVMRLHDSRGDRARALRTYHACASALARELAAEPSAATRAAYDALVPALQTAPVEDAQAPPEALIGRDAERARLTALWRAGERGRALLVLVSGEAGIGKSRLVAELRRDCARAGAATAHARCYPAEGALAYGPIASWLRSDALVARRGRLDQARLSELARLLPELSATPAAPVMAAAGDEQRLRLFDALAEAIVAGGAPLLLVLDDAQWADRETLQFLHFLVRSRPAASLLVAATARREELDDDHPLHDLLNGLGAEDRAAELELGRLSREDTGALAARLAGGLLDDRDSDRLYAETEGNPLFLVEALRAGWTRDAAAGRAITPKVQAVIESRLAALSPVARELAGVAATIGRDFTADLVGAASGAEPESLVGALDELWRRRIIHEQGADAYDFSHDRIREVAYGRVSPARRRALHLRVARALERRHANQPGRVAAQIAAHLDRAGEREPAIGWYLRAAQEAQRMHADLEAIRLLERCQGLLGELPAGAERDERELEVDLALLAPLSTADGVVASRLIELQGRGVALSEALGRQPPAPLLRSIALTSLAQGRLDEARRAGEQLRARGEQSDDDVLLVESHYVLGIAAFWQADLEIAREHFEAAVERYRHEQRATHLARYGLDPEVVCMSRLANTLWFLGQREAAVRTRDRALARAEEVGHPFSTAIARVFAGMLALDLGDDEGIRREVAALQDSALGRAGRAVRISTESLAGYVDVLDGRTAAGLARIRGAVEAAGEGDHAPGMRASAVRVLVEAHARAGDAAGGLQAADLMSDSPTGARLWEAQIRAWRAQFLADLEERGTLAERPAVHAGAHDQHHTLDPRHD
jgi:DNA-binding SARP family transcriptional activator